jgi:hypothetical protein
MLSHLEAQRSPKTTAQADNATQYEATTPEGFLARKGQEEIAWAQCRGSGFPHHVDLAAQVHQAYGDHAHGQATAALSEHKNAFCRRLESCVLSKASTLLVCRSSGST